MLYKQGKNEQKGIQCSGFDCFIDRIGKTLYMETTSKKKPQRRYIHTNKNLNNMKKRCRGKSLET